MLLIAVYYGRLDISWGMHLMPNAISALRIALTPIVIICLLQEVEWLDGMALVLFVIGAATDFADGVLARLMQAQSRLGTIPGSAG